MKKCVKCGKEQYEYESGGLSLFVGDMCYECYQVVLYLASK